MSKRFTPLETKQAHRRNYKFLTRFIPPLQGRVAQEAGRTGFTSPLYSRGGFTLIEFIMVIVLLGIVAGIGTPLLVEIIDAWVLYKDQREITESSRIALDRVVREIRRAASITGADDSDLQFIDIDGDRIRFDTSATALRRTLNGVTNGLADNVSSLTFTYYDRSDLQLSTPVATPSDIKRIAIDLSLSLGGAQLNTESQVSPRRLK